MNETFWQRVDRTTRTLFVGAEDKRDRLVAGNYGERPQTPRKRFGRAGAPARLAHQLRRPALWEVGHPGRYSPIVVEGAS